MHGRSREQRYTKLADWTYINQCAGIADPIPMFGNGDILSYEEYNEHLQAATNISGNYHDGLILHIYLVWR